MALASFPTLLGHCCRHCADVIALGVIANVHWALAPTLHECHHQLTRASLPMLHGRHCCGCTGVVAAKALALSPLLRWRLHQCCLDVIAIVALTLLLLVSSPTSNGCYLQYCMGAVANSHGHHCQHCMGINAINTLALLPLSYGCRCYGGVLAVVAPASLHGRYQPCGGGVVANTAWHLCQCCLNLDAIAALTLSP